MKKNLTKENELEKSEKAEKQFLKRYTLLRYNKLVSFILIGIFIICSICFALGVSEVNSNSVVTENDNPIGIGMTILLVIGAIGYICLPFFIFRRFSLAIILMGVSLWDVGMIFSNMMLEGEN
ncbi:MAG: hypothetical protein ACLRFG_01130, partial [Clostridia bacterium]